MNVITLDIKERTEPNQSLKDLFLLGKDVPNYNVLYLDAERTILKDKKLNIEIELNNIIQDIDKIVINGITYERKES